MKGNKSWMWLLFFGSLWGISEVAGGGILYRINISHSSIILSAWAFFILAVARGIINKPGSSVMIGTIAMLFKLINAAPFICHLLGIFMLGAAFDIFASFLMKKERKISWRSILTGSISAYSGYALFALTITYIVQYKYWIAVGLPKVLNHIFASGSIAALLAAVVVPLGFMVGLKSESLSSRNPRWLYAGTLASIVIFWIVGQFTG
jgi:hypothetical protein